MSRRGEAVELANPGIADANGTVVELVVFDG